MTSMTATAPLQTATSVFIQTRQTVIDELTSHRSFVVSVANHCDDAGGGNAITYDDKRSAAFTLETFANVFFWL
jgi:hypothetical protein